MSERQTPNELGHRSWFRRNIVWITLIPVLLSMLVIFGFSAQTAEQSSTSSSGIVNWVIRVFYPDYGEWAPHEQVILTYRITKVVRKLAHATEYAVLGWFLMLHIEALFSWRWWRKTRMHFWELWFSKTKINLSKKRISLIIYGFVWTVFFGTAYAATDEYHQKFVDGRGPGITDVFIDMSGVALGALILILVAWIVRRIVCTSKGKKQGKLGSTV